MALAKQANRYVPSNKLAVGTTIASLVGTQAGPVIEEVWPQLAPAVLAGPVVTQTAAMLVALLAGVAVGWFVPDAPNVPR